MNKYFNTKSAAAALAATITGIATLAGSLAVAASPAWAQAGSTTTTGAPGSPGATPVPLPPHIANRLAWVKRNSTELIDHRVSSLDKTIAAVQAKSFLGSDQASMVSEMQTDVTGLQALDAKIQADTDLTTALQDRASIFTGFRVYYLVLPVVSDITQADWYSNFKVPAINSQITQVQGEENSNNQLVLAPLAAGMQSEVGIITSATNGLAAQLLSYDPAQWNSDHRLLLTADDNLKISATSVSVAERDYAEAQQYLRSGQVGNNHHVAAHRDRH